MLNKKNLAIAFGAQLFLVGCVVGEELEEFSSFEEAAATYEGAPAPDGSLGSDEVQEGVSILASSSLNGGVCYVDFAAGPWSYFPSEGTHLHYYGTGTGPGCAGVCRNWAAKIDRNDRRYHWTPRVHPGLFADEPDKITCYVLAEETWQ